MTSRMTCFPQPVFYGNPCAPEKHGFRGKKLNSDGSLFNQRACRRFQVCRQLCGLMALSGRQAAMHSNVGRKGGLCTLMQAGSWQLCTLMKADMEAAMHSYTRRLSGRLHSYVGRWGCSYALMCRQVLRQICTLMWVGSYALL